MAVVETDGDEARAPARRAQRADPPPRSAAGGARALFDDALARSGRRAGATSATSPRPARARSIDVPHRPLLRHDHARARRPVPRARGARGHRHRRAARARRSRWTSARKVLGYRMTSQCASGSGQFLENIARYLGVTPRGGRRALAAGGQARSRARRSAPCWPRPTSSTWCRAASRIPNILKGIHQSMAGRYLRLLTSAGAKGVAARHRRARRRRGPGRRAARGGRRAEEPRSRSARTSTRSWPARSAPRCGARSARASCSRKRAVASRRAEADA